MAKEQLTQFITKKSYEISYALMRISITLQHKGLAEHLELRGIELLDFSIRENYSQALLASKSLEYLLQLGSDTGVVHSVNAQLIIQEIRQFNAAIAEIQKIAESAPIDLTDVFSSTPIPSVQSEHRPVRDHIHSFKRIEEIVPISSSEDILPENSHNAPIGNPAMKAAMRQSAILDRIRQSGNCRLKDLQEYFKDTSERTIRYDIQSLVERGLVDRLGNGGPSTYYRAHLLEA